MQTEQLGFAYFIPLSEHCDVNSTVGKADHWEYDSRNWEYDPRKAAPFIWEYVSIKETPFICARNEADGYESRKKTPFTWECDSIKETPFICTRNEADDSYMNSHLQTLYLTPCFRNVCLRLQNIIYKFQHSDNCVVTEDLTKPFGWDAYDFFQKNDVQGLSIVILLKLEDKAKEGWLWESNKACNVVLKLFMETGHGLDLWPLPPDEKRKEDTLVFKLCDPKNQVLRFAGVLFIKAPQRALKILRKLNKMVGSIPYEQMAGFTPYEHMARFTPYEQMAGFTHEQMVRFARGVIFAGTCHKSTNDLTLGMFHSNLELFEYTCQSSSSSKSSGFAPMYACNIGWMMMTLQNLEIHPRNLLSFQKDKTFQPPLTEVVAGNCTELPQEILMQIFDLLETPDLVRVGSVCCFWNSVYTNMCSIGRCKWPQTPCLIYTNESGGENVAFLHSLAENKAYKLTLPEPAIHRRYLIGSSQGWLITADERSEMHLVNPITSEQISLPSVITIEQVTPIFDEKGVICKYHYSRHTAKSVTGPPSTHSLSTLRDYLFDKALMFYDTSAGGYIVVLIHNPLGQLSFARLRDEKWTWLPPHSNFEDCIYKDGLLYAVTSLGEIFAFDLSGTVVLTKIIMDRQGFYGMPRVCIVEAPCGDLLLVQRPEVWIKEAPAEHEHDACDDKATFENRTWQIQIYKVNIASRKLVQINRLDDYVLFLGHNLSVCFRAEEYPQVKPNHVYFTDDNKSVYWKSRLGCRLVIGVLNLETKTMDEIVSPRPWSNCMALLLIIPNPRKMDLALHS